MAYQPIQMPTPNGLGDLAEVILAARRQSEQENQNRAEMLLRQKQFEAQQTQNYAHMQNEASRLGMEQADHRQAQVAGRIKAVQDVTAALDAGRPDLARQIARAAGLGDIAESRPDPKDALMKPSFDAPEPPAGQSGPMYEFGGFQPQRGPTYTFAGQQYDPQQTREAEAAARKRSMELVGQSFGGADAKYATLASQLSAVMNPDQVGKVIAATMEKDNAREATAAERETQRDFQRQENEKYRSEPLTFENRKELARIGAGAKVDAAGALAGPRQDQGDLQSRKYVDETIGKFEKTSGMPKLLQTMEQFNIAAAELQKPSGAAQVGARMAIERALRGGPPTQYMDETEQKHLSGIMGRLEGALETLSTGQFGEEQKQAIAHEIEAARAEYERAVDRRYQSMVARFKDDPAFANLQGTVNRRIQQSFGSFGRQVPDVFPGGQDRIGAVGSRSVQNAPVAPKPETVGLTDDPNDESPLPEDPNAEELPAATKLQTAAKASANQNRARANKLLGKPNITREQALQELRRRGLIP